MGQGRAIRARVPPVTCPGSLSINAIKYSVNDDELHSRLAFLQSSNARNISASALKQSTQTPNLFKLITKMPFTNTSPPLSATAGEGQPRTSSVLEHRAAALSHPNGARNAFPSLSLSAGIEKKMLFIPGDFMNNHKYIEVGETFYAPWINKTVVATEGMFIPGGYSETITVPDPMYALEPAEDNVRGGGGPCSGKVFSTIIIK